MNQTVIKIGNSAGMIVPQSIREDMDIRIGDAIEFIPKAHGAFLIKKRVKGKKSPITTKFAQMVDDFMTQHEDVLRTLANK